MRFGVFLFKTQFSVCLVIFLFRVFLTKIFYLEVFVEKSFFKAMFGSKNIILRKILFSYLISLWKMWKKIKYN